MRIIRQKYLVLGDLVQLSKKVTPICDFLLIKGRLICDESFITGESKKVEKSAIEIKKQRNNMEFSYHTSLQS